jgi:ABC-type lipoprotein release transport system permease subunit
VKLLITLAWRNLGRNRRRTIITITAVVFATLLSIAMRGLQLGTYEENTTYMLNLFSGYAQLQHPGFLDNQSLHKTFVFDAGMRGFLDAQPELKGYAPRLYADGLVSFGDNSLGAALFGVDPEVEKNITLIPGKLNAGRWMSGGRAMEVVLGTTLLENLKARIGDDLVVLAQGYDGSLGNAKYRIVGTVKTGMPDIDRMAVFGGIEAMQDLLSIGRRISVVALSMHELSDVDDVVDRWNSEMDTTKVRALSWEDVMPDFKQSIEFDNVSGLFFLGILVVVVAFGILNTVLMSVTERFREFGIMLSMGMPQSQLVLVVLFETVFIACIGVLIGDILAYGVNWYFMAHPIELGGDYQKMIEEYGWLPVMRSTLRASSFFNTTMTVLGISLLSAMYPLYRVMHLEPLKGIRYT